MLLLNIEYIPGKKIEALGIAKGSVVQSKNFGKDFMAGMKTLVGGEIESYTQMLTEARQIATKRMVDDAEAMGADAVIGIRYTSASVMQGAAEITAYGTAVRIAAMPGTETLDFNNCVFRGNGVNVENTAGYAVDLSQIVTADN